MTSCSKHGGFSSACIEFDLSKQNIRKSFNEIDRISTVMRITLDPIWHGKKPNSRTLYMHIMLWNVIPFEAFVQ